MTQPKFSSRLESFWNPNESVRVAVNHMKSCYFYVHKQYNGEYKFSWMNSTTGWSYLSCKSTAKKHQKQLTRRLASVEPEGVKLRRLTSGLSSRSWASWGSPGRPGWGSWPTRCRRWGSSPLGPRSPRSWGSAPGEGRGCCNPGGGHTVPLRTSKQKTSDITLLKAKTTLSCHGGIFI